MVETKEPGTLEKQIAIYEKMQDDLEAKHHGKWVVFYDEELQGIYESLDDAATEAATRFGRGPYLIRQVGEPPYHLPSSMLHRPVHADS